MGHRILVIEDSAAIGRLVEICLRAWGAEILIRQDGQSGLDAVATEAPDLVLLDLGIPGMDGWHVLAAIRSEPTTAETPVIVLTGHADEETRLRAEKAGASAFMTKPFSPKDLRQSVGTLLSRLPNKSLH